MSFIKKMKYLVGTSWATACKTPYSGWDRFWVFVDVFYCKRRYFVSDVEYLDFKFWQFKDRYRKNFLLRYHQSNKFKKINEPAFTLWKYKFYQMIPDCYAREMILAPDCGEDAFVEFAKKHGKIVTKPDTGSCGRDICFFTYTDDEKAREHFRSFTEDMACEELIIQHDKLQELSPSAVNTIRVVSFLDEDGVSIISATLRTGNQDDKPVDNLKKDGIGAQVDIETGIVSTCGFDYNGGRFVTHPHSGVQFLGFNIPHWDQVVAVVKKAHSRLPQCKLFGWDIAITQNGVDIIEANSRPGTPIMQMVDLIPKGEKVIRAIKEAEKNLKKQKSKRKK